MANWRKATCVFAVEWGGLRDGWYAYHKDATQIRDFLRTFVPDPEACVVKRYWQDAGPYPQGKVQLAKGPCYDEATHLTLENIQKKLGKALGIGRS